MRSAPTNSLSNFASTCEALAATSKRTEKIRIVAEYLLSCSPEDAGLAAQYLSARPFAAYEERTLQVGGSALWSVISSVSQQGNEGLNAAFRKHRDLGNAAFDVFAHRGDTDPSLTLRDLASDFDAIASARSLAGKLRLLHDLFSRATAVEAKYIVKIITGELRIGLKESLVEEAIASAFGSTVEAVKRANMLTGDISETVRLASSHRLAEAKMRLFHPIGFMLASPAESVAEAFEEIAEAIVEDKYDGIRAQAHIEASTGKVRIYSRTLDEVGESFPELAVHLATLPESVILDGEILAWRDGRALAFSELQKRLGRKRVTESLQRQIPVAYVAFDILAHDGKLTLDLPLVERHRLMDSIFERRQPVCELGRAIQPSFQFEPPSKEEENRLQRAPAVRADSAIHLEELFEAAQARGNEGLILKSPNSPYTPGRRGRSWLKLKRELATLDVVVTAAEYGNGKRAQVLSDYTFAVRHGDSLLNVGKAYNGLTDTEIAEMTEWFLTHTLSTNGHVHEVLPEIVIEVAFNAVMRSDRHASGFALRFPRIVRLRRDKPVSDADTLERVEEIYSRQVHIQHQMRRSA